LTIQVRPADRDYHVMQYAEIINVNINYTTINVGNVRWQQKLIHKITTRKNKLHVKLHSLADMQCMT